MNIPDYLQPIEADFRSHANSNSAMNMRRYMKDQFDFYGISSPDRKEILRKHIAQKGLIPEAHQDEIIDWCWNSPEREWQYICMELLAKHARKVPVSRIDNYERMITGKSWWDTVDFIASNLVGPYFTSFPDKIPKLTERWMASGNMWLQRTCLLFQLKYRDRTDQELLAGFILRLKDSREFFLRKAIGWSLREYSKTNPEFVRSFVSGQQLSGLSEREALKWLVRNSTA